jgi:hypothetical protein
VTTRGHGLGPRVLAFGPRFARARVRLTSDDSTRRKLAAAINVLAAEYPLPSTSDTPAVIPPVLHVAVRRAPGLALWIWYAATDTLLTLHALTDRPPA